MNNEIEFKENLNKIKENTILATHKWWGLRYAGYSGIIVTNNQEIYRYQYYHKVPTELQGQNVNYIVKAKELNDEEYKTIILFIENEIENKQFTDQMIFDAGFDVIINYKETTKTIKNNTNFENNTGIYDKTENLLNEILKQ